MKTPDEFKKNLIACMDEAIEVAENGDAHDLMDFAHHAHARMSETLTYIQQLEAGIMAWEDVASSPGAVEDMAIEINRMQAELEAVKRERDALMLDFQTCVKRTRKVCSVCSNKGKPICNMCEGCDVFEWRGVCPDTEVQGDG